MKALAVARARRQPRRARAASCPTRCGCAGGCRAQLGAPLRGLRGAAPGLDGGGGRARSTTIDPWFLREIREIVELESRARLLGPRHRCPARCCGAPSRRGSPTSGIAGLLDCATEEACVERRTRARHRAGVYKRVDTCAAEFPAHDALPLLDLRRRRTRATPDRPPEGADPRLRPQPHRPGHRVRLLLRARRLRAVEARATRRSWSTATRRRCRPTTTPPTGSTSSRSRSSTCWRWSSASSRSGVVVQLGGQTPLKLARGLEAAGVPILGHARPTPSTSPRIASASARCCARRASASPSTASATSMAEARAAARGDRLSR